MLTARDQQIVIERDLGDTIVEISLRHGISHQRVSVITRRAREVVTKAYMDLLVASNTGEQCAYVIPTDPTTRSRSTSRRGSSRSCGDSGLNLQPREPPGPHTPRLARRRDDPASVARDRTPRAPTAAALRPRRWSPPGITTSGSAPRCAIPLGRVFIKLDITSRNQLARVPPSPLNTWQIGD